MSHFDLSLRTHGIRTLGVAILLATLSVGLRADPPASPPTSSPPLDTPASPNSTKIPKNKYSTSSTTATGGIPAIGAAYSWGKDQYNQLGHQNGSLGGVPVQVTNLASGVTAVTGGAYHSVAIQNGAAYAWGDDTFAQLGDGPATTSSSVPVPVSNLDSGVTSIAAGGLHNLAIQNGAAYAWGYNPSGQVGDGSTTTRDVPVAVTGLVSGVTAVAGGTYHSLAIQNGAAYAWGYNIYSQLGDGTTDNRYVPVAVYGLSSGVTAIAGGGVHSLAIQNGAAYSWGLNNDGQLGSSLVAVGSRSYVPVPVNGLSSGVTAISAGGSHNLAVKNGFVYAWGDNNSGQLGNGTAGNTNSLPVQVDPNNLNNIIAIAATSQSSYALAADGSLWVWGANGNEGRLGLGTTVSYYSTPQHLLPPAGSYYSGLIGGGPSAEHAMAILFVPPSSFFTGETYQGNGTFYLSFSGGNFFGYYSFLPDINYIYHQELGYEYIFDGNDGHNGVFFYDFASSTFFYTSPTLPFPFLYDFTLNTFLYYYPDTSKPGHYTINPRYFYNFNAGQIITK